MIARFFLFPQDLRFISCGAPKVAGGTSLSVFMGAIGILCNVGKSKESSEEFKKSMLEVNWFKGDENKLKSK